MDVQRLNTLTYKVHEYHLEKVWMRFENAGFKPILIKGWAAAQFYTEPVERRYNDIDLIIEPDKYDEAIEFVKSFTENTDIDLHKGVRRLDSLSYESLYANSQTIKCGNTEVRVLRPEDHLRVLSIHWLADGGAHEIRLWDIYYAVKNRPADFDWERCLNEISSTRRKWIVCTIGLACKYLGLNVEDTPIAGEVKDIPQWLIKTVEKEWQSDVKLVPLHYLLHDKKNLFRQIKKRFPPNPIQATIDMEGEFDNRPRIFYQIGDIFFRLTPSVKRIAKSLIP
jgi:hypothetical protein